MGSNCGKQFPLPCANGKCNVCDVSVGDRPDESLEYFCTLEGAGGNSRRTQYCSAMSSAGEWQTGSQADASSGSCYYNDCNNFQAVDIGCCDGCCGINGNGLRCQRVKFAGDPPTCCLLDYNCSNSNAPPTPTGGNTEYCFSDTNQQYTCSDGKNGQPQYRDVTSVDCQTALIPYCTGTLPSDDPNSTAWLDRWTVNDGGRGSCAYALTRNLFTQPDAPCFTPSIGATGICNLDPEYPINAQGYFWGQTLITAALNRYTDQGFIIGALPGSAGYNPFQNFLYSNVCCPYPGLCQSGLNVACANYSAQRMSLNPSVSQWCGCHLPTAEYETYSSQYNIPPQCTPMCHRAGTIPIVGINGAPVQCEQNVCMLDGITVNLVNAQAGGGLNFSQVCGNCPPGECSCIVGDTTVDISNSTIGGNIVPINEGCGGAATCTQVNPGGTGPAYITVPCGTTGTNPYADYDAALAAAKTKAAKSSVITTMIIVGIVLVAFFLIVWWLHPSLYRGAYIPVPDTPNNSVDPSASALPESSPSSTAPMAPLIPVANRPVTPSSSQFVSADTSFSPSNSSNSTDSTFRSIESF